MSRPILPMTEQWRSEMIRPRGPQGVPQPGEMAPDFSLPGARYLRDDAGERVEYGQTVSLSGLRGRPVVLNLTRIVSDRFF